MIKNKNDLIVYLSENANMPDEKSIQIIDLILDWIMMSLKDGNEVRFLGFGSLWAQELDQKEGFHPLTGKKIILHSTKRPMFKGSKEFRKVLNAEKTPPKNTEKPC